MAISVVQTASSTGTSVSFTSSTTAGNCVVVVVGEQAFSSVTVTGVTLGGSAGNFSQLVAAGGTGFETPFCAVWADPNCAGGQKAIAVTFSVSNSPAVIAYEIAGLVATSVLDKSSSAADVTGSSWSSGTTSTTTQGNEIWIGGVANYGGDTITGPLGWTNTSVTPAGAVGAGYKIVSATGTAAYTGTFSGSDDYSAIVVTLFGTATGAQDLPQIVPGPTWLSLFKPGLPRPQPAAPPSGPNQANLPNLSDIPQIQPGTTWLDTFKPGMRKPRPQVPAVPSVVAVSLVAATVAIATPAPSVTGAGVALGTATVTIAIPAPVIAEGAALGTATVTIAIPAPSAGAGPLALSPGTVAIAAFAPGISGVGAALGTATVAITTPAPGIIGAGVALGTATVTIAVPAIRTQFYSPDLPHIQPGPAWFHRFKPGMRKPLPFMPGPRAVTVKLGTATVSITVHAIGTPPAVVALSAATVTITVPPVKYSRQLLISLASQAGTDDYGNAFPQGIYATAGVIQGPEFLGQDFIISSAGAFFYSGTPAFGNLIASIASEAGTDPFGNSTQGGFSVYSAGGQWAQFESGSIMFSNGATIGAVFSDVLSLNSGGDAVITLNSSTGEVDIDGGPINMSSSTSVNANGNNLTGIFGVLDPSGYPLSGSASLAAVIDTLNSTIERLQAIGIFE